MCFGSLSIEIGRGEGGRNSPVWLCLRMRCSAAAPVTTRSGSGRRSGIGAISLCSRSGMISSPQISKQNLMSQWKLCCSRKKCLCESEMKVGISYVSFLGLELDCGCSPMMLD